MKRKSPARAFGQDLLRGEGSVLPEKGTASPLASAPAKRRRKANAEPSGGGGGGWADMNEKLARNRAALTGEDKNRPADETWRTTTDPYRAEKGLAIGTQDWVQGKIAEGDISGGMAGAHSGTSIFELAYRWFCPPGGLVLDPFAGGSVRGVVASRLGRAYVGVDLRPEQTAANEAQARAICREPMPWWKVGDSRDIAGLLPSHAADFLFTCPPYADLEVYSDDPRDLSTMAWPDFLAAYRRVIAASCGLLKADRFACFVVGDARDANGLYYGLPWRTVEAFEAAGLRLYNEAVLVTAAGSLPIRTAKQFTVGRKLGKTHQNVLVFVKGDPVAATKAIGPVEFGAIEDPAAGDQLADPAARFGEIL